MRAGLTTLPDQPWLQRKVHRSSPSAPGSLGENQGARRLAVALRKPVLQGCETYGIVVEPVEFDLAFVVKPRNIQSALGDIDTHPEALDHSVHRIEPDSYAGLNATQRKEGGKPSYRLALLARKNGQEHLSDPRACGARHCRGAMASSLASIIPTSLFNTRIFFRN